MESDKEKSGLTKKYEPLHKRQEENSITKKLREFENKYLKMKIPEGAAERKCVMYLTYSKTATHEKIFGKELTESIKKYDLYKYGIFTSVLFNVGLVVNRCNRYLSFSYFVLNSIAYFYYSQVTGRIYIEAFNKKFGEMTNEQIKEYYKTNYDIDLIF